MVYTAEDAREETGRDLDEVIRMAVNGSEIPNAAYMRIYIEDHWCHNIESELESRGFKNIQVPDIILKGDVYFEW